MIEVKTNFGLTFTAEVMPHLVERVRELLREGSNNHPAEPEMLACRLDPRNSRPTPCFIPVSSIKTDSVGWKPEKGIFTFNDKAGENYQVRSYDLTQREFEDLLTSWPAVRGMICSLGDQAGVISVSAIVQVNSLIERRDSGIELVAHHEGHNTPSPANDAAVA